jgi:hypothetical protein
MPDMQDNPTKPPTMGKGGNPVIAPIALPDTTLKSVVANNNTANLNFIIYFLMFLFTYYLFCYWL